MSTPSMNVDVEGVKALLEQLRGSQAWQDVTKPPTTEGESSQAQDASNGRGQDQGSNAGTSSTASVPGTDNSPSVASLLAQLHSHSTPPVPIPHGIPNSGSYTGYQPSKLANSHQSILKRPTLSAPVPLPDAPEVPQNAIAPPAPSQDLRSLTYQQTLLVLSKLAEDPAFLSAVKQMKDEQDNLERQLWQDRRNIYRKYEDKIKVSLTKATLVGDSGLSKHEAEMLQAGLKKELEKFDRERVLVAWDGLIAKQQASLAQLGVPTMFATDMAPDREKQQKVMQVLEGFL